jgi:8-oxo-dGTP pyrophosphatase MutT (NUDIX family)
MYRYALVVCRDPNTGLYLIVSEKDGYWLPGGGVEKGESFEEAAVRETLEEAGIEVTLKGVLRVEFTDHASYGRMRVIYFAEPRFENQSPKTEVDKESLGASWMDLEQVRKLELRGPEPKDWIKYLERGGEIFPLIVFDREATKP